jgi:putative phosphoesterase
VRAYVLSDIHANAEALDAVLSELPANATLFCLGDVVGYGAEPNSVVEALENRSPEIVVAGNHDHAARSGELKGFNTRHGKQAIQWTRRNLTDSNVQYLNTWQLSQKREFEGVRLTAFHGGPDSPLTQYVVPAMGKSVLQGLLEKSEADVLLVGHSHLPFDLPVSAGRILCPGSVGQPRDGDPRASYGILDIGRGEISWETRRVSYDVDSAAMKILAAGLPDFLARRLFLGI